MDALTELVNLGVSNAALSLREMVREEVILSVPKVTIMARDEAIASLGEGDGRDWSPSTSTSRATSTAARCSFSRKRRAWNWCVPSSAAICRSKS